PAEIPWNGLDQAGKPVAADAIYVARLVVVGDAQHAEAASERLAFGVAGSAAGGAEQIWRGTLVAGSASRPVATRMLEEQIAALVRSLAPADRVEVLVHGDGTGTRLAAAVRTQREAALIAGLLEKAGVSA